MANNYYSNLYAAAAFRGSTPPAFLPKSANELRQGGPVAFRVVAAVVNLGIGDIIHLIPLVVPGSYLMYGNWWNDDLDSGTTVVASIGWTANPGTYLSGSTALQAATTGTLLTPAVLGGSNVASVAGDELILTVTAGSANVSSGNFSMEGLLFIP